ncbi:LuxR C-terminal-related transcriptional regulator [Cohnella caldifontis]|uniref:LuxR C-terminal-related transcriptional regulator n=1 Tax=Cohnella caldifontis TaxID=3027471 RepID=UPI0023EC2605|nr:LuxR C-terminal-related transcriptional regulator [Cohnella sp. YIM B05605]
MSRELNDHPVILLSKLRLPQPLPHSVPRTRLIDRLNEGLSHRATFLVAPAGYGKTTLFGDWARQSSVPVGWLALDEKDNDLVRFWRYVMEAIEGAAGTLSASVHESLSALSPGQYEPFLVSLLNEMNRLHDPLVLAMDDWHVITDPEIAASVSFFLEYAPPAVHLFFASRTTSEWARARWISRGWIQEIHADQMRFDLRETVDYFRICAGRELRREQIERCLAETEGWVTGLKLIALSWRYGERSETMERGPALDGRQAERYLLEEVFEALDEPTKRFLMDVSVLQRMNESLCEAVGGGDDSGKLAELADLGLFLVPLDDRKEWYRFHHLFGEFLRNRLMLRDPARTSILFRAAAEWCERQELLEEAVDYYLAGQQYEEAMRLLERMRSVMIRREFQAIRTWLSAIPEQMLMQRPFLYFSYIFSLLWAQEVDVAERHLRLAEQHYETASAGWAEEDKNRYLGYLYFVRNFKATQYDMDMIRGLEYIRLSLRYSPEGTDLIFASPYMPLAPSVYRSYNGKRGKHLPRGLSDDFFASMIEFMGLMGLQDLILICYGELLYERNELELAEPYLKQGLAGGSQAGYQPEKAYVPASLFLSRIGRARQDFAQAEKWLEEAGAKARKDGAEAAPIFLEAEMAALRLEQGDLTEAVRWKETYKLSADDPVSVYQLFVYVFLVRVLMETGERQAAWSLAEKLLPIAVKGHRPMDALDIQILQAMLLQLAGKQEEALLKLEEALRYAEPDDYVRVFVDKGKLVAELLAEYVRQRQKGNIRDRNAPSLAYVRKILFGYGGAADALSAPPAALETLLTPKEYAIFRHMEEGMDNPTLAETLGIGMGTLKAHINRIYSKLQAKNRLEAIKRGRELRGM